MTSQSSPTTNDDELEAEISQVVQTIKDDRGKALRAEKTVDGAEKVDDPRTAARFLEERSGVPYFEVVSTKVQSFPEGADMVGDHAQDTVVQWAEANDPDVIGVDDEDGFEVEA